MNCPHCHESITREQIRAAANSDAAKRKRPGAKGLVRNPAGRPKASALPPACASDCIPTRA